MERRHGGNTIARQVWHIARLSHSLCRRLFSSCAGVPCACLLPPLFPSLCLPFTSKPVDVQVAWPRERVCAFVFMCLHVEGARYLLNKRCMKLDSHPNGSRREARVQARRGSVYQYKHNNILVSVLSQHPLPSRQRCLPLAATSCVYLWLCARVVNIFIFCPIYSPSFQFWKKKRKNGAKKGEQMLKSIPADEGRLLSRRVK